MINLEKLYVRYNLKREHFIILLSVLAAIILIAVSILPAGQEKQAKIEYTPEDGSVQEKNLTIKPAPVEKRNNLDQTIIFAVLIAITPYSIEVFLANRRTKRYEEEFVGFLYELSELLRGGLDPLGAIKEIASPALQSERSLQALSPHLQKAAAQIGWGVSFDDVISTMAEALKSPLISKYSYLIVQASRLGAINTAIILKSADDLEKTMQLEREKEAALKEYLLIIYAAQFILIGLIFMLNTTLLPSILDMMAASAGGKGVTGFGISSSALNMTKFRTGFFHVIMINAFASGIIAGQLTEGKARHGLKHSVILMILGYSISLAFLIK
ncbi:MAG: type II secretion system F family protein [Candidatus Methanoperedens sp.]|nr:type II secretion system F family protein [Candidatus Methanoperedens sp.]